MKSKQRHGGGRGSLETMIESYYIVGEARDVDETRSPEVSDD
jgi:hypothetical protein